MDVAVILSAVLSLVGAGVAVWQAQVATRGAWEVASLNHQIAALDREAEQFREDFRGFQAAWGRARQIGDVGELLAAGAVLRSHVRASTALRDATEHIASTVLAHLLPSTEESKLRLLAGGADEAFKLLSREYRAATAAIARDRGALVTKRDGVRRWSWRRPRGTEDRRG